MRIYVCDNDRGCLNRISNLLAEILPVSEDTVVLCDSLQNLRVELQKKRCDLLLMDIEMGESENGIDAVSELFCWDAGIAVIYITGYALNYVSEIFYRPANVIGFLVKPIDRELLRTHIERARVRLKSSDSQYLTVSVQGTIDRIRCEEIRYLESKGHQVIIDTVDGRMSVYRKLADVALELPPYFCQCHKSYIVNFMFVKRLERVKIMLTNEAVVPVSRTYHPGVKDRYMEYINKTLEDADR